MELPNLLGDLLSSTLLGEIFAGTNFHERADLKFKFLGYKFSRVAVITLFCGTNFCECLFVHNFAVQIFTNDGNYSFEC